MGSTLTKGTDLDRRIRVNADHFQLAYLDIIVRVLCSVLSLTVRHKIIIHV